MTLGTGKRNRKSFISHIRSYLEPEYVCFIYALCFGRSIHCKAGNVSAKNFQSTLWDDEGSREFYLGLVISTLPDKPCAAPGHQCKDRIPKYGLYRPNRESETTGNR